MPSISLWNVATGKKFLGFLLFSLINLFLDLIPSGEMFDFIVAQKYVQEVQACKFFHQIVDGVESLHFNEITHRDLKPENLLLKASPDGWIVKVVDFGLSNTHEVKQYQKRVF
jgi:5'-AMP-activated protein kinase catalytic alpha subunit